MPTLQEGNLTFAFLPHWHASKFDGWSFYRNQFQNVCGGTKAIDILAVNPAICCWIIEVKDYRQHPRTKVIDLAEEVAIKVRDSLAGLAAAQYCANAANEKTFAQGALRCSGVRVVLHLEQPPKHSKLFPRAINLADVLQRLKQLIRPIDPHPFVVEKTAMRGLPWSVT